MNADTAVLIKLTDRFSPEVPLARNDDLLREVCAKADVEDKAALAEYAENIRARKEQGAIKRAQLKEGVATDEELAPYLDDPDPRAPKEVLRFVISLPLGAILLAAGLCCMYAVNPAYLEAHSALLYFGIAAAVFGALALLTALFAFISYCKIREYNKKLPEKNREKRAEAIADLDGQVAYEIMLADLLLKTIG